MGNNSKSIVLKLSQQMGLTVLELEDCSSWSMIDTLSAAQLSSQKMEGSTMFNSTALAQSMQWMRCKIHI
ncbi:MULTISPECIES: hypothetical protein [Vibrio]|uniref:Uncharacterized protein n=1 Tax=Vibrio aestuarianus TaxID=28171 RepID=A0A9X4FG86_9VIBR|nr:MULTISPECIES: hypothetical protein [Vibrio]MDE1347932.1 hypothetical protein [Vibrio aestuarianus]